MKKMMIKPILGLFTLMVFSVSGSFAQDSERMEDAQSNDVYTQDDSYQGTSAPRNATTPGANQDESENNESQNVIGNNDSEEIDRNSDQIGQENSAQTGQNNSDQPGQNTSQGDNRTQIAHGDLPSEVSNTLEEQEYKDWTVSEAYKIKGQGETKYEVHFETPQGETQKETFTESGEIAR